MKLQKSQLKTLIKGIVNEAMANEVFGSGQRLTPAQEKVVRLLTQRSFQVVKYVPSPTGGVDVILERPWGKGRHAGNRVARVSHDGSINQDKLDVNKFLSVVGEEMTTRAELDKGVMKAVNVEGKKSTSGMSTGGNGIGFKPLGQYNKHPIYESIHEQRPCPCGSGLMSNWEVDGRGIPLCRACPKCKKEKLAKYRPEILRPYDQSDVDEPIEPEDYQEGTGDEAGEESRFRGKFVDRGSIKLEPGVDQKLADKIANYHWDIFGSENREGVWHYKTRGNAYCCAVGMYQGKPALLSKTTDPFRNELLVGEEEIFKDGVNEQTGTGAVAGYATPFAFSKKGSKGSRAIKAAKKYGTVVKSISEETK